jgi:hypothetical protein
MVIILREGKPPKPFDITQEKSDQVWEALSGKPWSSATIRQDLAKASGVHPSSVQRCLTEWRRWGYISRRGVIQIADPRKRTAE